MSACGGKADIDMVRTMSATDPKRAFGIRRCCVRKATLVEPRVTPPESLKRTSTRLLADSGSAAVVRALFVAGH